MKKKKKKKKKVKEEKEKESNGKKKKNNWNPLGKSVTTRASSSKKLDDSDATQLQDPGHIPIPAIQAPSTITSKLSLNRRREMPDRPDLSLFHCCVVGDLSVSKFARPGSAC